MPRKQTTKVSEMIKGTIKMCLKKTHNDPIISVFEINPGNFLRRSSLPLEEWTPLGHILLQAWSLRTKLLNKHLHLLPHQMTTT